MKSSTAGYLNNRVLKVNVGFLLSAGPGTSRDADFDIPDPVRIANDLTVNAVHGHLRFSRMKEGILVQGHLTLTVDRECDRCLDTFEQAVDVSIEELYAHPVPLDATSFAVGADGVLDLNPLLRAEVLIETSHKTLCREDCQGICPVCGANRNHESCNCELDNIDPRLEALRKLLDSSE